MRGVRDQLLIRLLVPVLAHTAAGGRPRLGQVLRLVADVDGLAHARGVQLARLPQRAGLLLQRLAQPPHLRRLAVHLRWQ